jgi:hypothetical protein
MRAVSRLHSKTTRGTKACSTPGHTTRGTQNSVSVSLSVKILNKRGTAKNRVSVSVIFLSC